MRRIVLSLVVLCLCPLKAYAAGGDLAWAKRAGGADYERGSSIVALADGSALVTGYFGLMLGSSSATFGPGEAGETTLTSAGDSDIFIARYNPDGTLAWAKRAGGTYDDEGSGIAALADGSALATGSFEGSATFGPGEAGETTLTSAGRDIFIARYNPEGTLAWAKRAGGTYDDEGDSIAALAGGSALVTGSFEGSATFGPGEAGQTTLTSAGDTDIFIAKFNQPTAPTPVPTAQNVLNGTSFKAGQQLIATFKVNMAIGRMFNVYAVIILPDGKTMIDMMTLSPKIKPVATGVPSLPAGFSRQLLSITIPWSAPKGEYELLVAFFDPNTRITGRQDAFLQVSAKFTIQ